VSEVSEETKFEIVLSSFQTPNHMTRCLNELEQFRTPFAARHHNARRYVFFKRNYQLLFFD
jgi:hypothetical protein